MAQKTTVAIRFTTEIADIRRTEFVNELSRLIVYRLKKSRSEEEGKSFMRQWFRLPNRPLVFCINIWGEHETVEVRRVLGELVPEITRRQLPVVVDIVNE